MPPSACLPVTPSICGCEVLCNQGSRTVPVLPSGIVYCVLMQGGKKKRFLGLELAKVLLSCSCNQQRTRRREGFLEACWSLKISQFREFSNQQRWGQVMKSTFQPPGQDSFPPSLPGPPLLHRTPSVQDQSLGSNFPFSPKGSSSAYCLKSTACQRKVANGSFLLRCENVSYYRLSGDEKSLTHVHSFNLYILKR